jgi:hypothetical protein
MNSSVAEQTAGCARVVGSTSEAFERAKETHETAGRLAAVVDSLREGAANVNALVDRIRSAKS